MAMIQVNDVNFYYEMHGEGYPIILIAGYTSDHTSWAEVIDPLSQHFKVLVFDNRGVGQTCDDGRDLSVDLMADDVIALAEALKLNMPHVIGSSMGGTIVQKIAMRHCDKISSATILGAPAKWRQAMLKGLGTSLSLRKNDVEFDIQFDSAISWVFGQGFLSNVDKLRKLKQKVVENPHPQSLLNQIRQFEVLINFDSRKNLKNITVPTLLVYGVEDIITLPHEMSCMVEQIPNTVLHSLDCGHAFSLEAPKPLSELLVGFISKSVA